MTASQPGNCSSSQTQGGHIAFVRQDHKPGHAPLYLIRNRSYIIFTSNRSLEPRTLHSEMQYASVLRISLEIVGVWVLAYGGRLQAIQAIHSLSSSVNGSNDQSWVIAAPVTMLTTVHGIHFATYVLEFCFFYSTEIVLAIGGWGLWFRVPNLRCFGPLYHELHQVPGYRSVKLVREV